MNNFGVVEVASARTTTAPGWAYVPDTGINPAVAALQPAGRKRAARSGGPRSKLSLSDLSARQEAAVRKELELLDRDNFKDVAIPVPARSGGPKALSKSTPTVRKILLSQKTFANHLGDFEALGSGADPHSGSATPRPSQPQTPIPTTPAAATTPATTGAGASSSRRGGASRRQQQQQQQQRTSEDVEMTDAPPPPSTPSSSTAPPPPLPPSQPQDVGSSDTARHKSTILPAYTGRTPAPHPADADPLLASRVPALPTDDELRALLLAPPAPYPELMARARRDQDDGDDDEGGEGGGRPRFPPARVFCAVCGYWGRVKCIKCGTRLCALDCLDVHREECVTRYGL
ncbi:hypothetical protein RB595_009211 [Gaeumannomyces hyphopodioides]